jgi:hypothetical protein
VENRWSHQVPSFGDPAGGTTLILYLRRSHQAPTQGVETAIGKAAGQPRSGWCPTGVWGSKTRCSVRPAVRVFRSAMDDRRMLLSILYQMVRWLLRLTVVLVRRDLSKDAELLVLRHENAVLR